MFGRDLPPRPMTVRAFANLPGEMARRIREMDWSATPLGNSEAWPQSLKLSIAMILASGFPMAIRWGPELVLIYNDAYRPILRDKHPEALRVLNESLETEIADRIRERDRIWHVSEDLLGVSNFDGYFTSVNPAWTTLLGWSEDEIKRMHVSELRHPDDAEHSMAGRRRLAEGIPTVRMENRFRHKDGSWRWLAWALTVENVPIYLIGLHVTPEKPVAR